MKTTPHAQKKRRQESLHPGKGAGSGLCSCCKSALTCDSRTVMSGLKTMFPGRVVLRTMVLAVLAIAGVVCITLARDAIAPAEARSAATTTQLSSAGGPVGVRVRLEVVGTERDGITGHPQAGGTIPQSMGGTSTSFLSAGTSEYPSVCMAGFFVEPPQDYIYLWRLQTTAMYVTGGRPTLQVRWTRSHAGDPAAERDDTRTITLGPGDTHVLDFIENPDTSSTCASVMVRVAAYPIGPQGSRPVTVDLWTVDEAAPEGARSVHQRVQGPGSELLPYQLPPLDVDPWDRNVTGGHRVRMDVSGDVQAAIAADGFVDVTLTTVRRTVSGNGTIMMRDCTMVSMGIIFSG